MDAGRRLREAKEQIIRTWAERARERLPPARRQDPLALMNGLPPFVEFVSQALESPAPDRALVAAETALAVEHGRERALWTDWSLGQVVDEYHLLQQTLIEQLEPLDPHERRFLLDAIQLAIRNAVSEFERLRSAAQKTQ